MNSLENQLLAELNKLNVEIIETTKIAEKWVHSMASTNISLQA